MASAENVHDEEAMIPRDEDWTITPSINPELFAWLGLLGLPALLLYLIYAKISGF